MKTDDLIRLLAADTRRPAGTGLTLVLALVPALALVVLAVWLILGFRADLVTALVAPVSAARIVLTLALGLAAIRIVLRLARPEGAARMQLWPLAAVAAAGLSLWLWAFLATPADARQMAATGKTMATCLVAIPLLSVLPVTALHVALRQGATTAPAWAGFVAGLAGAGLSAAAYALHCTEDSPLFYVTWYGLAIMGVALASALAASRSLRW